MRKLKTICLTLGIGASFGAAAAEAHPRLVASTPASNASVQRPANIQLRFSENLIAQMSGANVVMTGMPRIKHHRPVTMSGFATSLGADGKSLLLARRRPLPAGDYTVIWHAVSVDTHRVAGQFAFKVI